MTEPEGWNELSSPRRANPSSSDQSSPARGQATGIGNGLVTTAFTKLARVHVLSIIGDGAIAVALAGSIFFSIDPAEARWRVALYLVLTIAPFAVVTPLLGPAIDRAAGGRRGMVIGSLALRMVLALLMSRHIDSFLLFPEAFAMLVLQKAYGVSRAALVPAVCPREDELIEANSKLSLLSSIGGGIGGAMGVGLIALFGSSASTILAAIVFAAGVAAALQLPQVQVAKEPVDATEKLEVRGANIVLAATAIAVLKGIVGFTTFLLAFQLRAGDDEGADVTEPGSLLGAAIGRFRDDPFDPLVMSELIGTPGPPQWHLGAAGLAAGVGVFLGAKFAPDIRDRTTEERIVLGAIVTTTVAAFLAGWGGGIQGTVVLAFGVAISTSVGKLGFDALVQRDAPRSNHGRAFAQFEGRFQLTWAIGAFIAVVSRFPIQFGAIIIALAAGFAAISYELGRRSKKVQASARVREAIRDRVPQSAVDRIESAKAVQTVKPVFNRVSRLSKSVFSVGASSVTLPPENGTEPPAPQPAAPPPTASQPTASQPPAAPKKSQAVPIDSTEVMPVAAPESEEASPSSASQPPPPPADARHASQDLTIRDGAKQSTGEHQFEASNTATQEIDLSSAVQTEQSEDAQTVGATVVEPQRWGSKASRPQVSGDGVWVSPEETPDGGEGEDGQFRLWE